MLAFLTFTGGIFQLYPFLFRLWILNCFAPRKFFVIAVSCAQNVNSVTVIIVTASTDFTVLIEHCDAVPKTDWCIYAVLIAVG